MTASAAAPLFHLVDPAEWRAAAAAGEYRPASLADDGFVHLSFADQVVGTAGRHFRSADRLVAVELDPTRLGGPVVLEDSYGRGVEFPHLYGPLPVAAAVAVHPLERAADGSWRWTPAVTDCGVAAAASPGR